MIDWLEEAEYVNDNPREVWLLVMGRHGWMDRFLYIMGNGLVSGWSQDEMILAILFYREVLGEQTNKR